MWQLTTALTRAAPVKVEMETEHTAGVECTAMLAPFHALLSVSASEKNEAKNRESRQKKADDPQQRSGAEVKCAGWRLRPNKLRQLRAGTADIVSPEIRNNQAKKHSHDQQDGSNNLHLDTTKRKRVRP